MTAVGFVVFAVFFVLFNSEAFSSRFKKWLAIGVVIGAVLLVAGIARWLWQVMP